MDELETNILPRIARVARVALSLALGGCALEAAPDAESGDTSAPIVRSEQALQQAIGEVSSENMREHVQFLASASREPGSPHLEASRDYCRRQLEALGYEIMLHDFTDQTNPYVTGYPPSSGRNVHGFIRGDTKPGELVMVSAHVDGVANCPGANDNGSGVAAVLEIARVLAEQPHRRTTIASCWDAEETGSVGSWVYAKQARDAFYYVKINYVFDMIGWFKNEPGTQRIPGGDMFISQFPAQAQQVIDSNYTGNFIAVVGNGAWLGGADGGARYEAPFRRAAERLGTPVISIFPNLYQALGMGDVMRSDHSSFWLNGYNALFITDTGEFREQEGMQKYHCLNDQDTIDDIDFHHARNVAQATAEALQWAADE